MTRTSFAPRSGIGRLTAVEAACLAERALRTMTKGMAVDEANDLQAGTAICLVSELNRTIDAP